MALQSVLTEKGLGAGEIPIGNLMMLLDEEEKVAINLIRKFQDDRLYGQIYTNLRKIFPNTHLLRIDYDNEAKRIFQLIYASDSSMSEHEQEMIDIFKISLSKELYTSYNLLQLKSVQKP